MSSSLKCTIGRLHCTYNGPITPILTLTILLTLILTLTLNLTLALTLPQHTQPIVQIAGFRPKQTFTAPSTANRMQAVRMVVKS